MSTPRPRIIAEVAQGYAGDPELALELVQAAAGTGADAIKFQIVYADDLARPDHEYYEWYKTLRMEESDWRRVRDAAADAGLLFFHDISGERALDMGARLDPDGIKIHSSNFFNRPLQWRAFDTAERIFIALGGIRTEEAREFLDQVAERGLTDRVTLLTGYQSEPTPVEHSSLGRIPALREEWPDLAVGFLDHVAGDSPDRFRVSLMAMALGVDWIEKHITLDRTRKMRDWVSALEPAEFTDYVAMLERLAPAVRPLGPDPTPLEMEYRSKAVKKVVAVADLAAGHTVESDDVTLLRTADPDDGGLHDPARVVGRRLAGDVAEGAAIRPTDLEDDDGGGGRQSGGSGS